MLDANSEFLKYCSLYFHSTTCCRQILNHGTLVTLQSSTFSNILFYRHAHKKKKNSNSSNLTNAEYRILLSAWQMNCCMVQWMQTRDTLDLSIMQYNDTKKKKKKHTRTCNQHKSSKILHAFCTICLSTDFFLNKSFSCLFLKISKERVWENLIFLSARVWCIFSCSFSLSSLAFQRLNTFLSGFAGGPCLL